MSRPQGHPKPYARNPRTWAPKGRLLMARYRVVAEALRIALLILLL